MPDTAGLAIDLAMEEAAAIRRCRPAPPPSCVTRIPWSMFRSTTLHEQFKHLHLSVWEKRLGVLLRLATLCVGIAAAAVR